MSDPNQQSSTTPQSGSSNSTQPSPNNNSVEQKPIPLYDPNLIPEYNPFSQTIAEPIVEPEVIPENQPQIQSPFENQNAQLGNRYGGAVLPNTTQNINNSTTAISSSGLSSANNIQNSNSTQTNSGNEFIQPTLTQPTKFVPISMPDVAMPIAEVQHPVPQQEDGRKKEGFNFFRFIFNLIPSIILVALIAMIVIIAKNFVDKTTITDFSEIGPAIIFHTTYNSETDSLEWLLLPPTPLGLSASIPKDFEESNKVNITCPIKSSNDIMDIVQSVINPKLGSCAFRAL
jgi:hypothetical protein